MLPDELDPPQGHPVFLVQLQRENSIEAQICLRNRHLATPMLQNLKSVIDHSLNGSPTIFTIPPIIQSFKASDCAPHIIQLNADQGAKTRLRPELPNP